MVESVILMEDGVPDNVTGVGFPVLGEIMSGVIANKTPIYV